MWRVRYQRRAANQLATAWNNAADRNAVTAASHRVDQLLARDPHGQGESRPRGRRIMFEKPLAVTYRIDDATRTVIVLTIRAY